MKAHLEIILIETLVTLYGKNVKDLSCTQSMHSLENIDMCLFVPHRGRERIRA